ncbi:hypothetical protein HNO51_04040 [Billgrantia sulfidoxydans]|uniref:Uncharacterized protein n=1 Tax=Billgrantia sulfidoxydans TaxID=2733484 RepID=A0ABX7W0I2_9GAMM|nr:hypothetical protein [Halomonas sulfidoxydans]QTP53929.1 hypothetical protein HNO51_04040 [Halomonas sulfidoxydans]
MMSAMTTGATPAPMAEGVANSGTLAEQNLFEHMARVSGSTLQAVTPADLGEKILNGFEGTLERMQAFSSGQGGEGGDASRAVSGIESDGSVDDPSAEALGGDQFQRMIDAFGSMFDHAVESRLMASCAAQTSGACSTLLRG